ncbi:MAG: hypothetical protein Greene041662_983 [Candidatus Peregrinibacteria bacterium Greene0416_62]|nr:MAG: hypothetical protein Greene041662_983 [Candidatus Peregrinibacteria bacterium Greene0416_62]TSC98756.1 MAG: hypothetical protein Greene101449_859 [Candidatus Peregrinibacteria bacterium Greene1014_49]
MTTSFSHRLWISTILRWTASAALILLGGKSLAFHISTVRDVRASALPLAQEIPALERRVNILKEQKELTELSHALRVGSPEEQVHIYALPEETDLDKVVTAFDVLIEELRHRKILTKVSPITFGDPTSAEDGIRSQPVTFEATLHHDGIAALQTFVRLSGLLSVADALSPEERSRLLLQTELENPAAIVALEQFLNTDLMTYLREPRPAEEQLLRSFSNQSFERAFRDVIRGSLLADAGRLFQPAFATRLADVRLWPMQMMDIQAISLEAGGAAEWYRVKVKIVLSMRAS